jgi:hypothetical protein
MKIALQCIQNILFNKLQQNYFTHMHSIAQTQFILHTFSNYHTRFGLLSVYLSIINLCAHIDRVE